MQADTLILLGDGFSATQLDEVQAAHPSAELWTLNASFRPGASRHFDIHWQQADAGCLRAQAQAIEAGAQLIISPFAPSSESSPSSASRVLPIRFPITDIFLTFGAAFYQRTLCFMLALAAYDLATHRAAWSTIALPGHDFAGPPHFLLRDGPSFWLGVLTGLRPRPSIQRPARSSLLQRATHILSQSNGRDTHDTRVDQPHLYGHPRHVTQPHARLYGWA